MQKLVNISKNQISSKGVQSLADRPNANAQYGVGSLSSMQLKLWFDKLASFLAEKINELQNALASDNAADYIRIPLDDLKVGSLQDLVAGIASGKFAAMLNVLPLSPSDSPEVLQTVVDNFRTQIGNHTERIENLEDIKEWIFEIQEAPHISKLDNALTLIAPALSNLT